MSDTAAMSPATVTPDIVCVIVAAHPKVAVQLAAITRVCAQDVGQPLVIKSRVESANASTVTLHLPAAVAIAQHAIWCLACRLACFCPDVRVSVLVRAETTFARAPRHQRPRRWRTNRVSAAA
jgi:hypothetical protein